jgi:glycerophosphoryl diester phosphodiesterase
MNNIKVVAHRGGAKERREENTLGAFQQAIRDGADGFECDVALTRDNEPVITHKPYYGDTVFTPSGKKISLADTRWKEVKAEGIPHLHEVLDFVSTCQLECYIEPKSNSEELITKIVEGIEQTKTLNKVHLITFFNRREILKISKDLNPKIGTCVILVNPFGYWPDLAHLASADMIVPGWKVFNFLKVLSPHLLNLRKKIDEAHSKNFLVYSGIADNKGSTKWLCELGVDGIYTNKVRLVKNALTTCNGNF